MTFDIENGAHVEWRGRANIGGFRSVSYLPAIAAAAGLDSDRISSMHFQRHHEPIAMGQ
jgi:hypothetical protein